MTHPQTHAPAGYAPPPPSVPPHQRSGAELAAAAELEKDAKALVPPGASARDAALALRDAGRVTDALALVAHAMPRRECVWWAWASARRVLTDPVEPAILASLEATERWIAQPTDENRRAAMAAAEACGIGTHAGCAGFAAFLSGGSLAPVGLPDAHPTEFLTARAAIGSLMISGMTGEDPAQGPERYAAFLQQGFDVMTRLNLWPAGA